MVFSKLFSWRRKASTFYFKISVRWNLYCRFASPLRAFWFVFVTFWQLLSLLGGDVPLAMCSVGVECRLCAWLCLCGLRRVWFGEIMFLCLVGKAFACRFCWVDMVLFRIGDCYLFSIMGPMHEQISFQPFENESRNWFQRLINRHFLPNTM
jgi:hypothetical protein